MLGTLFSKILPPFFGIWQTDRGLHSVFQSLPVKKSHNFHCHKWFIRIWSWGSLFDYQCKKHLGMFCEMRPGWDARKGDWGENLAFGWLLKLSSKSGSAVMSLGYPGNPLAGQDWHSLVSSTAKIETKRQQIKSSQKQIKKKTKTFLSKEFIA